MTKTLISFGFSLIEAAVMIGIPGSVLPSRQSKTFKCPMVCVAIIMGAVGINVIGGNIYLRTILLLSLFGLLCLFLYDGPMQITFFYLLYAQYICVVSEKILLNIVMVLPRHTVEMLLNNRGMEAFVSILIKVLVIMAGILFVYYINKIHPRLPTKYWIILDIILLCIVEGLQVLSVVEVELQAIEFDYLSYVMVISHIIIMLGIFLIYFLGKICWVYEKQTEYELAQLRGNELQKIVTYQEQTAIEIKRIRHDIKKHLTNISYMLDANQIGEAVGYVCALTDTINITKQNSYSGNYIIDAILNNHLALCKSKQINLELSIDKISGLNMNPVDISAIMDNLLDNAVEAVENLPEQKRRITLKLFSYKDNLTVVIKNPYIGEIKNRNGKIYTSKSEWENHGYGLKSVTHAIERNHGVFKYYIKDCYFVTVSMLPIN